MKNANVPEVSLPASRRGKTKSTVTFLKHGDMGVPWDPKLFLPNNVRRNHLINAFRRSNDVCPVVLKIQYLPEWGATSSGQVSH
jgi:hypothetical protein